MVKKEEKRIEIEPEPVVEVTTKPETEKKREPPKKAYWMICPEFCKYIKCEFIDECWEE